MSNDTEMKSLARLIGSWTTEATHPAMPGLLVHGTADVEWLDGERFLILRAHVDHPDFPDSISIIGFMDQDRVGHGAKPTAPQLRMHYFDSRGVFRALDASADAEAFYLERLASGFSQRFKGTFTDGDQTIVGLWQMNQDDKHWHDDVAITYRRRG